MDPLRSREEETAEWTGQKESGREGRRRMERQGKGQRGKGGCRLFPSLARIPAGAHEVSK